MGKKRKIQQTLRKMRTFALFMFLGFCTCHATIRGQEARIDLKLSDVTLSQVFKNIEQLTDYMFIYKSEDVQSVQKISVDVQQTMVRDILVMCLKNTGLSYTFKGDVIVIQNSKEPEKKEIRIAGRVTDNKKEPLPGVTISVKGLSLGTATDSEGKYALKLPEMEKLSLIFSFVGMKTQEIKYSGQDTINVVMQEDVSQMEEVVVTGYQQIDKRHLTSAVNSVRMEDIDVPGANRIDMMLEGRIPGLMVMQNTGQVGAAPKLRIRGTSPILGSQEPLWVVDGIIQQDPVNVDPSQLNDLDFVNVLGNAISGLNPNDIERIDVLKDASATALYGAKAANGVIVITTKVGKVGAPTVTYSMDGTFTQRPRYSDRGFYMMNSKERVDVSRELMEMGVRYSGIYNGTDNWIGYEKAYLDYYKDGVIGFDEFTRQAQRYETMNTDWLKILTKDVFSHNHSLSISGGTENIRYYASFGYADERGNMKGEENERYSSSVKLTAMYDKFTAQIGVTGSVTNKKYNPGELNVMSYAHSMSRAIPLRAEDGELWYYKKDVNQFSKFNIVSEMDNSSRDIDQNTVNLTGQVRYNFTKDLKLIATGSYSFSNTREELWFGENSNKVTVMRGNQDMLSSCPFGGILTETDTRNNAYTLRAQVDYSKYLGETGKHFVNAMAGYELSSTKYYKESQELRGYYKDRGKTFPSFSITSRDASDFGKYQTYYMWLINNYPTYTDQLTNMMSGLVTLTYGYDDRYIINVNARADWSNAFGSRSNDKFFPVWSVSGRWNVSNDVLKNVSWIENLAVRLSYGLQGNILNTQPSRLIIRKGDYDDALGGFVSTVDKFPNPNLKWEKTHSYNVGVDFSFLEGKISGSFAYFYKKTKDAFLEKRVASQNGLTSYVVNAGSVENKGVELALNFTPINNALSSNGKRGFVWRIDPQLGQTLNTLINNKINRNNDILQDEITVTDLLNGNAHVAGTPLNTFYSYRFNGLDNTGRPTFKGLEDSQREELAEKYTDMAKTDKKDVWMAVLGESGTRVPELQGGVSNYFAYRNFSLSFNLTYSIGNKVRLFKLCSGQYGAINPAPHNNLRKEFVNRWRYPGDEKNTNIPGIRTGLVAQGNTADVDADYGWWRNYAAWSPAATRNTSKYELYDYSDLRVVRGDYLRLQSLSFRYVFDENWIKKCGMSSAYISLSATNLFTICDKKLKGQNPEQSGTSDLVNISVRPTYSVSLNVSF